MTKETSRIQYTNGYKRFNACDHYKAERDFYPVLSVHSWSEWPSTEYLEHSTYPVVDSLESSLSWVRDGTLSVTDKAEFVKRAYQGMIPTLETGFELTNFVLELGDIKSLVKWWDRGKSLFRNLSQNTLNYSFGLSPFISDCQAVYDGLLNYRERLQKLKEGAGLPQVRHFKESHTLPADSRQDVVGGSWPTLKFADREECTVTCNATMDYTYSFPDLDRVENELYALLDALGVQLDAYTIWNAIPYSFVVDWFFNVGDFLKQHRKRWIPIEVQVKSFGVSYKAETTVKHGYIRAYGGPLPGPRLTPVTDKVKYYNRSSVPLREDRLFNITSDGELTFRKFVLGSLLIEQRVGSRS
jgi:hypothetical protein